MCIFDVRGQDAAAGRGSGNLKREGRLAWLGVTTRYGALRSHRGRLRRDCELCALYCGVEQRCFYENCLRSEFGLACAANALSRGRDCQRLGGGGHENAAAAPCEGPLSRARDEILEELRTALDGFEANGL